MSRVLTLVWVISFERCEKPENWWCNLQLEKVDNKEMSITVMIGTHIADAEDIFEIESGGINYICIDRKE